MEPWRKNSATSRHRWTAFWTGTRRKKTDVDRTRGAYRRLRLNPIDRIHSFDAHAERQCHGVRNVKCHVDCSCTVTRTASRTTRSNYWTIYRIVAQSRAIDTPRYRHKKPTDHDTRRTNRRLIQSTSKPSGLTVTRSKTDQLLNRYTDIDDINSTSDRRSIARELQKYTSIMIQQYGDHVDTVRPSKKADNE